MSYSIYYSNEAAQDLTDILVYLSQFYPSTPIRFRAALEHNLQLVSFNPHGCPRYEHRPEYRKLNVKKYLVFYEIDEEAQCVKIYRIRHGSQNIQNSW